MGLGRFGATKRDASVAYRKLVEIFSLDEGHGVRYAKDAFKKISVAYAFILRSMDDEHKKKMENSTANVPVKMPVPPTTNNTNNAKSQAVELGQRYVNPSNYILILCNP